ncbi:hypothetical protein PFISCL1PPCAC_11286, partial [Pristionchus fissidentatus]
SSGTDVRAPHGRRHQRQGQARNERGGAFVGTRKEEVKKGEGRKEIVMRYQNKMKRVRSAIRKTVERGREAIAAIREAASIEVTLESKLDVDIKVSTEKKLHFSLGARNGEKEEEFDTITVILPDGRRHQVRLRRGDSVSRLTKRVARTTCLPLDQIYLVKGRHVCLADERADADTMYSVETRLNGGEGGHPPAPMTYGQVYWGFMISFSVLLALVCVIGGFCCGYRVGRRQN